MLLKDKKKHHKGFFKVNKNHQNFKKNSINFNIEFSENILTPKYEIVDRISNLTIIPNRGEVVKVMTTKNILSSEILDVINRKYKILAIDLTFEVISLTAAKQISKYNVVNVALRNFTGKYKEIYKKQIEILNAKNTFITITHCKNYLLKCENDNYFSIITSANPKVSSDIENYHIYNSKKHYNELKKYYSDEITEKK